MRRGTGRYRLRLHHIFTETSSPRSTICDCGRSALLPPLGSLKTPTARIFRCHRVDRAGGAAAAERPLRLGCAGSVPRSGAAFCPALRLRPLRRSIQAGDHLGAAQRLAFGVAPSRCGGLFLCGGGRSIHPTLDRQEVPVTPSGSSTTRCCTKARHRCHRPPPLPILRSFAEERAA